MEYIFLEPMPLAWVFSDFVILLLSTYLLVRVLARSPHPLPVALEVFAFIFLYAGLYENMSGVQGTYTFGRSLVMLGDVPLTVPLIEIDVLLIGLWMLEKMVNRPRLPGHWLRLRHLT